MYSSMGLLVVMLGFFISVFYEKQEWLHRLTFSSFRLYVFEKNW